MPVISASDTSIPAIMPIEHPIETVFLRASRAARRTEHRFVAIAADHDQIAGIDRHSDSDDRAARLVYRHRYDILAIAHCRCAKDHQHVACFAKRLDRFRNRTGFMRRPAFAYDMTARPSKPLLGDTDSLVEHAVLDARQDALNEPDLERLVGAYGERLTPLAERDDCFDDNSSERQTG